MFLVIEGIDGSGKSTQVELLAEKLRKLGKTVSIVDFPRYAEPSSFFVKKYLAGDYEKHVSAEMSSLFFAMDRYDASFELKQDLETYDYVIANRYVSSSMIHHGCKIEDLGERQKFLDWLEDLEYNICKIPKPERVFFLSLSLENNLKLIHSRAYENGTTELDLHEGDNEYLRKAWEIGHRIARQYDWEIIDCEEKGELLARQIITDKILGKIPHPKSLPLRQAQGTGEGVTTV